jgi:predicted ArsR family transcriptional regulator
MEIPALAPYHGFLGDTPRLRVVEEMVASMETPMTAEDYAAILGISVIEADAHLRDLVRCGFALQLESFPTTYVLNHESHRAMAMTFLAFAVLDDAEGTGGAIMDGAVREYLRMLEEDGDAR